VKNGATFLVKALSSPFKLWAIVLVALPACSDDSPSSNTPDAHASGGNQANTPDADASGGDRNASGGSGPRQDAPASGGVTGASGVGGSGGRNNTPASGGVTGASGVGGSGGRNNMSASGGVAGASVGGSGGRNNTSGAGGVAGAGGVPAGSSGGHGPGGAGGSTGGSAGASQSGAGGALPPPPTGTPAVRQWITFGIPSDNAHIHDRTVTFQQSVLAGSTILVLQAEAMLAPPDGMLVDDSANVTYSLLDTFSDQEGVTKTFIRSNVSAGALSVHAYFPEDQWQTILAMEITNVSSNPVVGHGSAKTSVTGGSKPVVDAIASPAISVPAASDSSPALLVAFGVNLADYVGGQGAPVAGTNFTTVGTMFNWHGVEVTTDVDSSILESRLVTQPGQVSGTFTSKGSGYGEGFLSCATVLR